MLKNNLFFFSDSIINSRIIKKRDLLTPNKDILVLSTSSSDHLINLSIAILLRNAGFRITLLLQINSSDLIDGQEQFISEEENKKKISEIKDKLYKFDINLTFIEDFKNKKKVLSSIREKVKRQSIEDTQRLSKNSEINLNDSNYKNIFNYRLKKNTDFSKSFINFLDQNKFDNHIIYSGSWAEYGVAFSVLKHFKKNITCYGYRNDKNSIVISKNTQFNELNLDKAWENKNRILSTKEKYIAKKLTENFSKKNYYKKNVYLNFHTENPSKKKCLYEKLGLSNKKRKILILTSLSFDTTVLTKKTNHIFKSQFMWLKNTLDFLKKIKNCQVIIRPHPAEKLTNCKMTVSSFLSNNFSNLGDNISVLPSNTNINTYGLIDIVDFGIVYSSDIGWEMVLRKKPVIACGKGAAWGKNIQFEPNHIKEYYSLIKNFIDDKINYNLESRFFEAQKFMHLYLNDVPKSFPFPLIDSWDDKTYKDLKRFIRTNDLGKYKDTFFKLASDMKNYEGLLA